MKISDDNKATFSTGRTFSIDYGIIGISGSLDIFCGYDGALFDDEPLTPEERQELADFMIQRWHDFKFSADPRSS